MADPVALKAVKVRAESQAGLIKMLETMLEEAKEGKLQSVAAARVYANDHGPDGAVDECWSVAEYTNYAMSHSILRLQAGWSRYILEQTD